MADRTHSNLVASQDASLRSSCADANLPYELPMVSVSQKPRETQLYHFLADMGQLNLV